jgi:hypothetical protein
MRTADPNRYLDEFLKQVQDGLDQFDRVDAILDTTSVEVGLRKSVAEDACGVPKRARSCWAGVPVIVRRLCGTR